MPISRENIFSALSEITRDSETEKAKYEKIITTQAQRDEAALPERMLVYPRQLVTFPNHPFYIREDEDMSKLKESIMHSGIRTPIEVVRTGEKNEKGEDTFYIVAGHRRTYVARQLYSEDHRVEIRVHTMSMDEAIIAMTESNLLTRESILPCERGNALRMEVEAKERIAGRPGTGEQAKNTRTRDEIGAAYNMTGRNVQNYIRLSYLIPDLQHLVDDGKIGMTTGVELSYLSEKEQNLVWDNLQLNDFEHYPSKAQAIAFRKRSKEGALDIDAIVEIMDVPKPNQIEHIRYVPRKDELLEMIPAYLQASKWKDEDFSEFITNAIIFYANKLMQEHPQKVQEESELQPIDRHNRDSYEKML